MPENTYERLIDMVCDGGTPMATCGFCGRVHFTQQELDPSEYRRFKQQAETNPEQFIEHDIENSISIGQFEGVIVVHDCRCNRLQRYEEFIWNHREIILRYLKQRIEGEKRAAAALDDLLPK